MAHAAKGTKKITAPPTRFTGSSGKKNLVEALLVNRLANGDKDLASAFAVKGQLVEFDSGDEIVAQDASEGCVYFMLIGEASVYVNGRHVADRGPKEVIGEMAALDPTGVRSASVRAKARVTAWCIDERQFRTVAEKFPAVWRNATAMMADRLRERARFHRPPNPTPILFIGSSSESLSVAKAIEKGLKSASNVNVRIWTTGVFGPSGVTVLDLLKQTEEADFAAFVFAPDDRVASRKKQFYAPRDNVVFELGLFMGALGRERTLVVMESGGATKVKIPTDLLGVTAITYVNKKGSTLDERMGPVCTEIEEHVNKLGVR